MSDLQQYRLMRHMGWTFTDLEAVPPHVAQWVLDCMREA
jgi:hypothetical protein